MLLVTERLTDPLALCKAGKSLMLRWSTPVPPTVAADGAAVAVASQALPNSEDDAAPNQTIFTKLRRVILEFGQANHSLDKWDNDGSPI